MRASLPQSADSSGSDVSVPRERATCTASLPGVQGSEIGADHKLGVWKASELLLKRGVVSLPAVSELEYYTSQLPEQLWDAVATLSYYYYCLWVCWEFCCQIVKNRPGL